MKKFILMLFMAFTLPLFSFSQYGYDDDATQHLQCNVAFGLSTRNIESVYQLELGVKSAYQIVWPSLYGEVYTRRDFRLGTSKDPFGDRAHTYKCVIKTKC